MNANFPKLYFRMFYKPASTYKLIFESNNSLRFGFFSMLIPALGYTIFYIMAYYSGGSPSSFKPWLALPIEQYFMYDIFLSLPAYYLSWAGASLSVYLLCRIKNSKVKFDHIAAIMGLGIGIATWSSMLHDLTDAVLSIFGIIDMREYERLLNEPTFWRGLLLSLYTLYFFWFLSLFTIGIRISQGFGRLKSLLIAFIGLFSFQIILLIFIR